MVEGAKWIDHALQQSKKSKSYRKFYNGIGSNQKSIIAYSYHMDRFMRFAFKNNYVKTKTCYDDLIIFNEREITDILQEYVFELNQTLRETTIKTMLSGPELFFEMNYKIWHKKIVRKSVHRDNMKAGGYAPATDQDILNLLSASTLLVEKTLLHFLLSTGIRPGGIYDPILKRKHIVEMTDGCAGVMVYDESKEGYWSFLTPEAYNSLKKYFEFRVSNGEILDDDSPLFLNTECNPMAPHSARKIIYKLIKKSGIKRIKNGNRYDKAVIYMFRKRFNGKLKMENSVNSNIAEKLMAHKRGLDGTYLQPTREECFREFVKAVPQLTVDPTERQRIEIETKQQKIDELEAKTTIIDEQENRIKQLENNQKRQERFLNLLEKYPQIKD